MHVLGTRTVRPPPFRPRPCPSLTWPLSASRSGPLTLTPKAVLEEACDVRDGLASVVGAVSVRARLRLRESLAQLAEMGGGGRSGASEGGESR
jgi:hypothetical protein